MPPDHTPDNLVAYIAPKGFESDLLQELRLLEIPLIEQRGRLFLCERPRGKALRPAWAQNIWLNPMFLHAPSINHAAQTLRGLQRNWACHPTLCYRRAALIQEKLPKLVQSPLEFGAPLPFPPPARQLGAWTLWREDLLLASQACSSQFADGELSFLENKKDPPGRAYLKLWEALTLCGAFPAPGEFCLDLGSSPGGWTWALAALGAQVISVDKAPLAANVAAMPHVDYRPGSAFSLAPAEFPELAWLCSDVICYPEKLYRLLKQWLDAGYAGNIICTLKFQGETDFESIRLFREIPGGCLLHLYHNKHELTWIRLAGAFLREE